MLDNMVKQKNELNNHIKEIEQKKNDVNEILNSIEVVEKDLDEVKSNEVTFLKYQMQEYHQRQAEEECQSIPAKGLKAMDEDEGALIGQTSCKELEHEDQDRLSKVRTVFYSINQMFEHVL